MESSATLHCSFNVFPGLHNRQVPSLPPSAVRLIPHSVVFAMRPFSTAWSLSHASFTSFKALFCAIFFAVRSDFCCQYRTSRKNALFPCLFACSALCPAAVFCTFEKPFALIDKFINSFPIYCIRENRFLYKCIGIFSVTLIRNQDLPHFCQIHLHQHMICVRFLLCVR